jgi:hypothetical protein
MAEAGSVIIGILRGNCSGSELAAQIANFSLIAGLVARDLLASVRRSFFDQSCNLLRVRDVD